MSATAITGWAWRTPLGDDVDGVVRRLATGARAAAPLARFPTETYACRWAVPTSGSTEETESRLDRWLDYYRSNDIAAIGLGAVVLIVVGAGAAYVLYKRSQGGNIRGNSTQEFSTTEKTTAAVKHAARCDTFVERDVG